MQLVDNIILERWTYPALFLPTKIAVDHLRRTMNTVRLKTRGRIGSLLIRCQLVEIKRAIVDVLYRRFMIPARALSQRDNALAVEQAQIDSLQRRRPQAK